MRHAAGGDDRLDSGAKGVSRVLAVGGRGYAGRLVVAVLAVVVTGVVGVSSAQAEPKVFGGFIGGNSGNTFSPQGPAGFFLQPRDVAVYEGTDSNSATDKMFVVEAQGTAHRVQRLDVDGNFELAWGRDVVQPGRPGDTGTGAESCTVAADCQYGGGGSAPLATFGTSGGEFDDPQGVAVSQVSGRVYVFDRDNRRVQEFDLDGSFVRAFGRDVGGVGVDVCTVASACQAGTTGAGAGQFATTSATGSGIAVSPVAPYNVFVTDPVNRRVLEFGADGDFLRGYGFGVDTGAAQFEVCTAASGCAAALVAGVDNGRLAAAGNNGGDLAVDGSGVVYVGDASSAAAVGGQHRILRFDSDPAPAAGNAAAILYAPIACCDNPGTAPLASGGTPGTNTGSGTVGLEIDTDTDGGGPDEEHLLVLRRNSTSGGASVVQEFDIPSVASDPIVTVFETHSASNPTGVNGFGANSRTGINYVVVGGATMGGLSNQHGLIIVSAGGGGSATVAVQPASNVGATSATLQGIVDPNGTVGYRFEYSTDGVNWTAVSSDRYLSAPDSVPVSATLTGLTPNTQYRVRIVATKVLSISARETTTSGESTLLTDAIPPTVAAHGAGAVGLDSAILSATVNPNGSATSYYFEYGTTTAYGSTVPVPHAAIGSGTADQVVSQRIEDLFAGTTYHYRVVAYNGVGSPQVSADMTFTTKPAGASQDLGGRGFELVSPADKVSGVGVGSWYQGPGSSGESGMAARSGERFAVMGNVGATLMDGAFAFATDWAYAERGPGGWTSHSPVRRPASGSQAYRFMLMGAASEDFSTVTMDSNGGLLRLFPELSSWQDKNVPFIGDWEGRWEIFGPLEAPSQAMETEIAVSADGSRVVGSGPIRGLTGPDDPTHVSWPDLVAGRTVYVSDVSKGLSDTFPGTAERSLVNACTDGTEIPVRLATGKLAAQDCPAPLAGRSARLISDRGAAIQAGSRDLPPRTSLTNVVSRDGSRVFFMSPDPADSDNVGPCSGSDGATACPPQLYVRQRNGDGTVTTRWISRAEDGLFANQDASLTGQVLFEGATPDGSTVFFRTNSPLTADDPNGDSPVAGGVLSGTPDPESWDLYMYELPAGAGDDPGDGELTRITRGPTGSADPNGLQDTGIQTGFAQGLLRFASDDGDRVYFATSGTLPGVGGSSNGTITTPGGSPSAASTVNLYMYQRGEGGESWRFVARLPRGIGASSTTMATCASTGVHERYPLMGADRGTSNPAVTSNSNCVRGTSDGGFITFWTDGRLTADDPNGVTGDVYGYDSVSDELTRVSAPRGGVGGSYPCTQDNPGTGDIEPTFQCFGDGGFESGARNVNPFLGVATDPLVAGDRVAFFQSRSRLVAGDRDDGYDVYQWRNGELSLVTTGASATHGAFYRGNDRTGRNVYFATRDRLSWQDHDEVLDIYTARVGGGIAQPIPPVLCDLLGSGCQAGSGAGTVAAVPVTASPGGRDSEPAARRTLAIGGLSAKARRRAARTGVLKVAVRSSANGRVAVVAKARIARRLRRVGRGSGTARAVGATTVRVRLSRPARRVLAAGRRLRLQVTVSAPQARAVSRSLVLRRAAR
jgi:hypothetical protein